MIETQAKSATKHDSGKPRLDLLPVEPLLQIAKVLAFGAQKYGDHNWRSQIDGGFVWGAALRCHPAASICLLEW